MLWTEATKATGFAYRKLTREKVSIKCVDGQQWTVDGNNVFKAVAPRYRTRLGNMTDWFPLDGKCTLYNMVLQFYSWGRGIKATGWAVADAWYGKYVINPISKRSYRILTDGNVGYYEDKDFERLRYISLELDDPIMTAINDYENRNYKKPTFVTIKELFALRKSFKDLAFQVAKMNITEDNFVQDLDTLINKAIELKNALI